MDIAQVAQIGIGAVTLFVLKLIWDELKESNKFQRDTITRLLDDRDAARAERAAIMEQVGLDPNDSGIYKRQDLGLPAAKRVVKSN